MAGWQDSFVPADGSAQSPQAVQAQGWQSSFVPNDAQQTTQPDTSLPGEQLTRQVGLAGRYIEGSIPEAISSIADLAIPGLNNQMAVINKLYGTNIPAVPEGFNTGMVERGLNATGLFPEPETTGERAIAGPAKLAAGLMAGGENIMPMAEEAWGNLRGGLNDTLNAISPSDLPEQVSMPAIQPSSGDIKLIKQKLELAGITPQQYADALMKSSPDDFAGELGGEPLRMQTQAQAKITGPSMQDARDAMRQRLDTAPQRVQQLVEQTFFPSSATMPTIGGDVSLMKGAPAPFEPVQQMQGNLADVKDKLGDLYSAADNAPVPRKPFLDVINTPNGQAAMKSTVERLANQNIRPQDAGIVVDPESGFYGLQAKDIPVSTMQEVSKSLGGMVKRNPLTGAIEDPDSLLLEGQRKQITSYLSENSPEFNKANTNAAAQFQGQSAFEAGRKLAHAAAGENADALAQRAADTFSPQELSYQKAGYAQGLGDALQGSPLGGGNPASRIAKGTVQNTTADILQSPTQAQQFAEALMLEKNRVDLAQRGLYGANTAESLSAGIPEIPTSAHGVLSSAAGKMMDFVNAGKNERIAQLLYATSPEQKAALAQKILK